MDTMQLKLFLSLSKTLNFTKTANEFYVTQPTVSNYIKVLENSIGVTLLKRDSHSVSLTEEGKEFVVYATQILSLEAEAENRLKNISEGRRGYIRIATLSSSADLFSLCLEEFVQKFPGVQVNVDMIEGAEMIAALEQCSYDIYFAHEHMVSASGSIDYCVTSTRQMDLVIHRKHAHVVNMDDWSTLAQFPFVSALETGFSLAGQIRRICRNRGISPDVINYYNRADTILLAVNAGIGISILPPQLLAFYNWPNVAAFPIEGSDAVVSSVVAWNRNSGNPEVERFLGLTHLSELRKRR
ncbi:MAG: LysR family transcriptional regulator [Oscillospiraceae bacterium]|nr:LysR family transcriptional regulator [Oscillospiraceae bacterium]